MRPFAAVVIASFWFAPLLAAQSTDSTSWMRRPEIREIRTIVAEVQRQIDSRTLVKRDTTIGPCDEHSGEIEYTVYTDRRGVVRRLIWSGASEDHGEVNAFTYDSLGHLRFAFSDQSAVNGSDGEVRTYWSPSGVQLHQDSRTTKGDGYPWSPPHPIFDAKKELAKGCEE